LAGWIIGGIGVILFVVYFVIAFFPGVEAWSDLVWPIILIIVGVLLLYRYYHSGLEPKP
jgi:steroid 5-alpha reductase family enzyme